LQFSFLIFFVVIFFFGFFFFKTENPEQEGNSCVFCAQVNEPFQNPGGKCQRANIDCKDELIEIEVCFDYYFLFSFFCVFVLKFSPTCINPIFVNS